MLYLRKSLLPGAGKGLFTDSFIAKGEIVCEYEGEFLPWKEIDKRSDQGHEGYAVYISQKRSVDAYFTPEYLGRYANDARGIGRVEGLRNNAVYDIQKRDGEKRVFIVATRNLQPGEEILVYYGDSYWKYLSKTKHLYEAMKKKKALKKKKAAAKKKK